MLFAFICNDKPGGMEIRKAHRPEHLAYLKSLGEALKFAGPFLDEAGEAMTGSLIVLDTPSLEEAKSLAAGDPFAKAGLFASVEIRPWRWTIGNPDEGA